MKLILIAEANPLEAQLMKAIGTKQFKKWQDPGRPENTGRGGAHGTTAMPYRTGNQDTPLNPRLRRFFNAPNGATQGKSGYGEVDDVASRRPHPAKVGEEDPSLDQDEMHDEIEKKARTVFGKDAAHEQLPRATSKSQLPAS